MRYRYQGQGEWLKGNTHIHTALSDGAKSPQEIRDLYREAGYDFITITDHWNAFDARETFKETEGLPLVLDGIELDGFDEQGHFYHIVLLGSFGKVNKDQSLEEAMRDLASCDPYIILAHPHWSGNRQEDLGVFPFDAIEIYNHVTDSLNGKSSALLMWDTALRDGMDLGGIAADDTHLIPEHPGYDGGWIELLAEELSTEAITRALKAGEFYSSTGPQFHSIEVSDSAIHCTCSPIRRAWLVGEAYYGKRIDLPDQAGISEFTFTLEEGKGVARSSYLRLEIEDSSGKRAWTNALWRDA